MGSSVHNPNTLRGFPTKEIALGYQAEHRLLGLKDGRSRPQPYLGFRV